MMKTFVARGITFLVKNRAIILLRQTKLDQKTPLDYLLFQTSIEMFETSLTNARETNKERGKEQQKNLNMLNMHDGRERYVPSNRI